MNRHPQVKTLARGVYLPTKILEVLTTCSHRQGPHNDPRRSKQQQASPLVGGGRGKDRRSPLSQTNVDGLRPYVVNEVMHRNPTLPIRPLKD